MSAALGERPHLDWYRKSAKKKLAALRIKNAKAKLADAQLAVAQDHGFASWRKLVSAVRVATASAPDLAQIFHDAAQAIVRRDSEAARSLIQNVPEIVHRVGPHPNWGGRPQLLHLAIEAGDETIALLLLDAGADPSGDNRTYDGWSPLMLAVHWKRNALCDLLIERGAAINLCEALLLRDDIRALPLIDMHEKDAGVPNNGTPLHFARTVKTAGRLLQLGVPIDAKDKHGHTALDTAAARRDRTVVDLLRRHGAFASPETFAQLGDLKSLKTALAGTIPDAALLQTAARSGHVTLVRWLLAQGIDVNQADRNGAAALHQAAFEGHLPVVKLLVKAGANVHAEDDEYNATPAGWAQHAAQNLNRAACLEVAAYLQQQEEKQWSVNTLPPRRQAHKVAQWKPIMDAAFHGDAGRIDKLLKAGVSPNALSTTPGAHRPLHRAIEHKKTAPRGPKHEAAVKALLAGGADPSLRGGYSRLTALQLAALDSPQFVPLLIDAFRPLDLWHACAVLDRWRVESLLAKDRSLAIKPDANGFTPLHYVAGSKLYRDAPRLAADQLRIARALIDAGARTNATFPWPGPGHWPIPVLYFACGFNDNPALTELLLQAGAEPYDNESVYHASDEGHSASLAMIEKYADKTKLAKEATQCLYVQMHWGKSRGVPWLLAHGADPNVPHPQFGNSALHQAARLGSNDRVLTLLLKHGGDPLRKNADGKSAIDLAAMAKKSRVAERLRRHVKE